MLLFGTRSKRVQRRSIFWLVSLLAVASARAESTEVAGTLPEDYLPPLKAILERAWAQSPQTIERALEVAQQEGEAYILNSERLPRLGGSAEYASNESAISGAGGTRSRDQGFFYRLELSQSLFRWGELKNRTALGRLGVLIAEKNYAEAYRGLANVIRESYMELVARKLRLKEARFRYQLAEDDVKLAKSNFQRGMISPGDMAGKELSLNESAVRLGMEEEDFAAARRALSRLAGVEEITEGSIPDEIPRPAYSAALAKTILAELLREGGKFTFEAEMNALRAQEADLRYRIARVRLLPKFDAVGVYGLQNLTTAAPGAIAQTGISQQTVAVRMNWAIFDGFATRGEKIKTLAARQLFERKTQLATEAALERAQQLERRLALEARAVEYSEMRTNIARAGVVREREEFQLGKTSELGIANATANRYSSEASAAAARANFLARWSEFVSLAGLDPVINNLPARYVRANR